MEDPKAVLVKESIDMAEVATRFFEAYYKERLSVLDPQKAMKSSHPVMLYADMQTCFEFLFPSWLAGFPYFFIYLEV